MMSLSTLLLMSLMTGLAVGQTAPINEIITKIDMDRFKVLAEKSLSQADTQELSNLFYASNVAKQINYVSPSTKTVCEEVKTRIDAELSLQEVYYIAGINKALNCGISSKHFEKLIKSVETPDVKMQDLFYGVHGASNLGITSLSADPIMKKLVFQLSGNDVTLAAQVYGVQVASIMSPVAKAGSNSAAFETVFSLVEDIVGQADEVNEKYLQLEGGLGITSLFIEGAFSLAAKMGKAPTIIPNKLQQLSTYIMSRKENQNTKSAYFVLMAAQVLSNNKYLVPAAVTLVSPRAMSSTEGTKVQIKISNLIGGSVSGVNSVVAEQVNRPSDGAILVNKETLKATAADKSVYELDLLKLKPQAGFYTISVSLSVSTSPGFAKLVGAAPGNAKLDVKITSEVVITNMYVAVIDAESLSSAGKGSQIEHPNSLKSTLSADSSQKVVASFTIKDKQSNIDFEPHQVFMRIVHIESQTETFFVCEKSGSGYEFEMKVKTNENALNSLIGDYEMHLIVGDAVITNSFMWQLGKISFHFADGKSYEEPSYAADYKPKPEIHHLFRKADPRPAVVFSQAFALLALVPLALLIFFWLKLEANVSSMQMDMPTIGFHGGLAAIFGLYYCYWAYLNMFQTLKCLAVIGAVTFFSGHKLLKKLALARLNNSRAVGG